MHRCRAATGRGRCMRSYRRDAVGRPSRSCRGTARRIVGFARPYRRDIVVFLVTVVIGSAVIGVATPVLAGRRGQRDHRGGPAPADRGPASRSWHRRRWPWSTRCLSLAQRWYSARIGEGIILDLRTQVYDHVQRMPLQFFTRTQTGALVSRLNNDVHRRPAGVHLDAVRRGQQRHPAGPHRRRDVHAVLADHRAVAGAAADLRAPGPAGRRAAGRDHPGVVQARRAR